MKKFTLLIAVVLLCIGTVSAAEVPAHPDSGGTVIGILGINTLDTVTLTVQAPQPALAYALAVSGSCPPERLQNVDRVRIREPWRSRARPAIVRKT